MSLTSEEVSIRLGVDGSRIEMGMQRAGASIQRIGNQIGERFTHGINRLVGGFSVAHIIMKVREVAEEFDKLKDKPVELQARFGDLMVVQREALENISESGGAIKKFFSGLGFHIIGVTQLISKVAARMWEKGIWGGEAYKEILAEDIAKTKELHAAMQHYFPPEFWDDQATALLKYKAIVDGISFKNMVPADQIKTLKEKNRELKNLADQPIAPGSTKSRRFEYLGAIAQNEQTIRDIESKMPSGFPETIGAGKQGLKDPTMAGVHAYNLQVAEARRNYASKFNFKLPTISGEASRYDAMAQKLETLNETLGGGGGVPVKIISVEGE